jgi:hypothetical protein
MLHHINALTDIHQSTPEKINSTNENDKKSTREQLGLNLSPTDTTYIIWITSLVCGKTDSIVAPDLKAFRTS